MVSVRETLSDNYVKPRGFHCVGVDNLGGMIRQADLGSLHV